MKTKYLIAVLIVLVGAALAGGVLFFPNLFSYKFVAKTSPQWTESAGGGISAPACGSSSVSTSCQGSQGTATLNWAYDTHYETRSCWYASITGSGLPPLGIMPCNGSYTYSGLSSNTTYSYNISWLACERDLDTGGCMVQFWDGPVSGSFTTPNCVPSPPTASIVANPTSIPYGGQTTVIWSSTNATSCTVTFSDAGGSWSGTSGNQTYSLFASRTHNLSCTGPGGTALASATVSVGPPPPGDFSLSVGGGLACNSVPLSWTASSGADGYRILKGSPRVDITPYQPYTALNFTDTSASQNTTYQYQIEAYNSAGTNRSNEISVTTPYCSPTLNFSGNPTSIFEGQSTTLTWSTSYVTSCAASGAWSGSKAVNGSEVVIPSPPPSATYTLTCTGPGGSTGPQSVIVNITPLALPEWKEIIPR